MVDELRRLLALCLPPRFEDAGLSDAAEVVVDGGPPTDLDHVETDGAGEPVGLGDTVLDTVRRDTRTAVAVALLVEGIHPERDAMREQRGATGVVEGGEPVPKCVVILGQLGLPRVVP